MDKQSSNRKKRRSRGEGVTSYRVTSSLSLTDQAYEHQQKAKQRAAQTPASDPYANTGYSTQANTQYDPAQQGYYDQQQAGQEGYYDQTQGQQGHYDQQQAGQEGYYDQSQGQQGYYDQQQAGQEGYYDQTQGQQGYYDQQQAGQEGYDQAQGQQGYYDQQQAGQEGYYDQAQGQQGYYDQQQAGQEGYYDQTQGQQGYYDQQGGQEGQYDQGYYDQPQGHEQPPEEITKRKRKISSVKDYFDDMLGAGHVMATDAEDSPFVPSSEPRQSAAASAHPQPPPHLVPQSPLLQLLGPLANVYLKLREKWQFLTGKMGYYADMMLDLQDSVQKEFKEALGLAFKGFLDQLRQKSPLYQQVPAYAGGAPGDPNQMDPAGMYPPAPVYDNPVSFVELHELNVEFTDNYDQPLFDFSRYANSQYQVSRTVVDPQAMEQALWSIRECAARAGAIPPAQEGPYANIPLPEIMNNITDMDLQSFLQYVKAYPGNYVSRSLKISETFATWVVYGAPSAT